MQKNKFEGAMDGVNKRKLRIIIKISLTLVLLGFLNISEVTSQNLVMNPGFENFRKEPPLGVTFISNYTNWNFDDGKEELSAWYFYDFNKKKNKRCWRRFNVPSPISGNGMAGISPEFYTLKMRHIKFGQKLQGELKEQLVKDKLYCVSFNFNFSETSWDPVEELATYFYKEGEFPEEKFDDKRNIKVNPQLSINDSTLNTPNRWHCFSKIYKAEGGEKYFLLGNFIQRIYNSKAEIPWLNRKIKKGKHAGKRFRCYNASMYFIDDVSIVPISDNSQCNCQ